MRTKVYEQVYTLKNGDKIRGVLHDYAGSYRWLFEFHGYCTFSGYRSMSYHKTEGETLAEVIAYMKVCATQLNHELRALQKANRINLSYLSKYVYPKSTVKREEINVPHLIILGVI